MSARDFLGGSGPPFPQLPYVTEQVAMNSERALDGFVVLGCAAALYGLGWALREFAMPNFRPLVFALVGMGALVFIGVNPILWEIAGVTVDEDALTCHYWTGESRSIPWGEVTDVTVDEGALFPMFLDDTTLVVGSEENVCAIPAFLPGSAEVAVVVEAFGP